MPSKDPRSPAGNRRRGAPKSYTVFHVRRSAPDEILIDEVSAAGLSSARRVAARLFRGSAILRVVPRFEVAAREEGGGYPSARFIRGEFLKASFADEKALQALSK